MDYLPSMLLFYVCGKVRLLTESRTAPGESTRMWLQLLVDRVNMIDERPFLSEALGTSIAPVVSFFPVNQPLVLLLFTWVVRNNY